MTIAEKIRNEVDRGRLGLNHGISMGMPKLESVIDGVTKETYTLIISNSGAGKTSFALYAYVYKPIMEHLDDDDFKCLYFSMELNEVSLYIKLLSIYIFETYGIELSYKEILSKKREYVLSDEHYQLVLECLPWIEKVSKKLEIYDKALNAKKAYAILKTRLEAIGRFEETENRIATIEDYNIDLYIPTRILRPLTPPTDVSVYNKGLKKGVKWEHVPGAEQYEVYLNDVLLETTEYNGYVSDEEFEGFMKIRALNELSQSEFTEPFYIKSIPNEPFQAHLENYIEAGEHVFQISFADYSELEDNFRIKYSVDGKPEELVELEASPGVGTIRSHIIRVPVVEKSFRVCVTAINEIGETEDNGADYIEAAFIK